MASLQDIRHRIRSVKSTKQITSAMNMVATSRLRHAKEAAIANGPYAAKVMQVVKEIAATAGGDFSHPLLAKHPEGKRLIFLVTSDKGLAGAYSSNACWCRPTTSGFRFIISTYIASVQPRSWRSSVSTKLRPLASC